MPAGTIPARPGVTGVGTMPALSAGAGVIEAGSSPALELNAPNRPSHNGRKLGVDTVTTVPVCKINEGNEGAGTIPGPLVPRSRGDRVDEVESPAQGGDCSAEGVDRAQVGAGLVVRDQTPPRGVGGPGADLAQGMVASSVIPVTLGVGGGPGQTRYDYSGNQWQNGRWREEHDVEGPGAGTFITVVGLQVDGRWHDGVLEQGLT